MTSIADILSPNLDQVMELFSDSYLSQDFHHEHFETRDVLELKTVFEDLAKTIINTSMVLKESEYRQFIDLNLKFGTPYVDLINELGFLREHFMHQLLSESNSEGVVFLCKVFGKLSTGVANRYLDSYINKLFSRNNVRLVSLSGMQDNIVQFYAAHIIWLNEMVKIVQQCDTTSIPELNPSLCHFGKWLESEGKLIISNNSKYQVIVSLHKTLHFIGSKIQHMLDSDIYDAHASMTYLQKAELISLEIGAELALIDNRIIMRTATKDPLTDLLNRSLLEQMFYDQYEIALITQKNFVLVMCDVDNFKIVNDTYGHNAGDSILKLFSQTLKDKLRSSDLIFRYGGDEFIAILPASMYDDVKGIFCSINELFKKRQAESLMTDFSVTLSTGVLDIHPEKSSLSKRELFKHYLSLVDHRLYTAKNTGRNRVE